MNVDTDRCIEWHSCNFGCPSPLYGSTSPDGYRYGPRRRYRYTDREEDPDYRPASTGCGIPQVNI